MLSPRKAKANSVSNKRIARSLDDEPVALDQQEEDKEVSALTVKHKASPILHWGRAKVGELFGVDLRSLAAFRIVLALLVLGDLFSRATDLYAHYTDAGVLPRAVVVEDEEVLGRWAFSLNLMSGEALLQALLFAVAALSALGLLVGYRTRLMTLLVWLLILSIQWRNPLVDGAGETLLRMLLLWSMFLPLGAFWSVDRALKGTAARRWSTRFVSVATAGLFLQIAFMYWFTALLKSGPEWRVEGTALYYALSIDQLATPIGTFLLHFPALLEVLTFATIGLEAFGPFLLFFPFFTGPVRTGAVLAFMSFQVGIWLTMPLGIFQALAVFCMVCFLPGWFWDKVTSWLRPRYGGVRRVLHAFWVNHRPRLPTWPRTEQPSLESTAPRSKEPITLRSSLAANLLASLLLLYALLWNIMTVSEIRMPERLAPLGTLLGVVQTWNMFTPYPLKDDGWYVIPGTLQGGQEVDLSGVLRDDFGMREVSWEKPHYVRGTYKNEHWRKYLEVTRNPQHIDQHLYLGRYICREWNARHTGSEQLTDFEIVYMVEMTLPDYEYSTPEPRALWEHNCF